MSSVRADGSTLDLALTPQTYFLMREDYKFNFKRVSIPEPLDLIAKSVQLHDEQVRTGAPISFLNLERFQMGRKLGKEKFGAANGGTGMTLAPKPMKGLQEEVADLRSNSVQLPKYMIAMFNLGRVVYCRYGKDYLAYVNRQILWSQQNPAFASPFQ